MNHVNNVKLWLMKTLKIKIYLKDYLY